MNLWLCLQAHCSMFVVQRTCVKHLSNMGLHEHRPAAPGSVCCNKTKHSLSFTIAKEETMLVACLREKRQYCDACMASNDWNIHLSWVHLQNLTHKSVGSGDIQCGHSKQLGCVECACPVTCGASQFPVALVGTGTDISNKSNITHQNTKPDVMPKSTFHTRQRLYRWCEVLTS